MNLKKIVSKFLPWMYGVTYKKIVVDNIFKSIDFNSKILEIGGGYNPKFKKDSYKNAKHLDHLTKGQLIEKYKDDESVKHLLCNIEEIDYVWTGQRLNDLVNGDMFEYVFSSHAIEHQVDFIGHLNQVSELINENGKVIFIVPDCRTCFDAFRYPTVTSAVLAKNDEGRMVHTGVEIFDCIAQTINYNDSHRPNFIDKPTIKFKYDLLEAYQQMSVSRTSELYQDCHAWTFTPETFHLMLIELLMLKKIELYPDFISKTFGNSFVVVLSKIGTFKEMGDLAEIRLKLSKKVYL